MGELNEEKLKQMLEAYSNTIEAKISAATTKAVREIKDKLEEQENSSAITSWLGFGVAVFAIGIAVLLYGVDRVNSGASNAGLAILGISIGVLIIGSYLNTKLSKKR